eukprot:TRINITY_DN5354_c0_g1_i1.p1 TRINITY_DN5354_c0_g1~~TRINITY_DN5354_c0_g1_i1.p1  ORF type:complete len:520 (+),score=90.27 TRINITY_DN5354_c0_g1_i1:296-1855(+)
MSYQAQEDYSNSPPMYPPSTSPYATQSTDKDLNSSTSTVDDSLHYDERQTLVTQRKTKAPFFTRMLRKFRPKDGWKAFLDPKNSFMLILLILLVIFGTSNRVFFKKMTNAMINYPYFLSQLTTFVYLPIFWPIVWYSMFSGAITAEQREFPLWKFLVMGGLDSTAGLLMLFGGALTSGPIQLLLAQGAIPGTMLCSYLVSSSLFACIFGGMLKVQYRWNHYTGALIIIGGIALALAPKILYPDADDHTTTAGVIIFSNAIIPLAVSGVYKEIAFKGADLDVNYVNAWVATFQLMIGIMLMWVNVLPKFGGYTWSELPSALIDGGNCLFFEHNTIVSTEDHLCNPDLAITSSLPNCDNCVDAWIPVGGYVFFNCIYNVLLLMTIKHGSAALFYVASALILPLSDICFTSAWIMGKGLNSTLLWEDIVGLCLIILGLIVYRAMSESADEEDEDESDTRSIIDDDTTPKVPVGSLGAASTEAEGFIIAGVNRDVEQYEEGHDLLTPQPALHSRNVGSGYNEY